MGLQSHLYWASLRLPLESARSRYRSAKKRKLGAANFTFTRQSLEIAAIALIWVMIFALNNLKYLIATQPVMLFLVPVWAIVAYLVMVFMPARWLRGESMTS